MTLAKLEIEKDDYHKEIDDVYNKMLLGEYKPERALLFFQSERNKLYNPYEFYKELREEGKNNPALCNNAAFLESLQEAKQNQGDALLLDGYIKKLKI